MIALYFHVYVHVEAARRAADEAQQPRHPSDGRGDRGPPGDAGSAGVVELTDKRVPKVRYAKTY